MEKWQQQLIADVTGDSLFRSGTRDRDREILEYLAMHSSPESREKRSARNLRDFFPPHYDSGIPTYIAHLERKLREYFEHPDVGHGHCIVLMRGTEVPPESTYSVHFPDNPTTMVRRFWRPYIEERFADSGPILIVYGVPLFIRSDNQNVFTRHADWNIEADVDPTIVTGEICWPFVAHGDIEAVIRLYQWFAKQRVPVDFADLKAKSNLKDVTPGRPTGTNVIAVGSTRVNGILAEYQESRLRDMGGRSSRQYLPFRLQTYNVVEVDDHGELVGSAIEEEKRIDATVVPVVITRRQGTLWDQSSITLIAANHGRAVHQTAAILTNRAQINKLFADVRLQQWRETMPLDFQIVLNVEVRDREQVGGEFTVRAVWPAIQD